MYLIRSGTKGAKSNPEQTNKKLQLMYLQTCKGLRNVTAVTPKRKKIALKEH